MSRFDVYLFLYRGYPIGALQNFVFAATKYVYSASGDTLETVKVHSYGLYDRAKN